MTTFIPTTVSIHRGTSTDSYGDEIDSGQVWAEDVPAAITEVRQRSHRRTEQRGELTEQVVIRFRPGVDITEEDRVVDDTTGATYVITDIHQPPSPIGRTDIRAAATRVAAQSLSA